MRFLIGIIFILLGLVFAIFFKKITPMIGLQIGWAEKYLGTTYYGYFVIGIVGIIIGLLILTNVINLGWFGI